jgi:hypothetical protein
MEFYSADIEMLMSGWNTVDHKACDQKQATRVRVICEADNDGIKMMVLTDRGERRVLWVWTQDFEGPLPGEDGSICRRPLQ